MKPVPWQEAIAQLDLLTHLSAYDPVVIGTPPLGIAVDGSDIDIACSAANLDDFTRHVADCYGHLSGFSICTSPANGHPAQVANFDHAGWPIELFCQTMPTIDQWGVRHFHIEDRLLSLAPDLRAPIKALKAGGMKTEPAFAHLLGLAGDPYVALLALEGETDTVLQTRLADRRHYWA